ncbi:MAG: ribonuclease HI family protein [bacterium]
MIEQIFQLFTDGGSRGNPGLAASACLLFDATGKTIALAGQYLGIATNNQAEYQALLIGIKLAKKHGVKTLDIFMDSELIIKQFLGEYKIKDANLKQIKDKVDFEILGNLNVKFHHIPRKENYLADSLVNIILDQVQ